MTEPANQAGAAAAGETTDSARAAAMQALVAEYLGTALLVCTVVGSGIMAADLAAGNTAVALLGNTLATGAILFVLICLFGALSGAHFNPAVTLAFLLRREIGATKMTGYVLVQILGAVSGAVLAHAMFDLALLQSATTARSGPAQWLSEVVATFGLVLTILGTLRFGTRTVAASVGLYISAGYWFTASTSFANPAVTIGRVISDTFSGIRPEDAAPFIAAQLVGSCLAFLLARWFWPLRATE